MQIINLTPDSFSDGGRFSSTELALTTIKESLEAGAKYIDIGGVSTRPGSSGISESEELKRVEPLIKALKSINLDLQNFSIDTYTGKVAAISLEAGFGIVNDISGAKNEALLKEVAKSKAKYVLMFNNNLPHQFPSIPSNNSPLTFFEEKLAYLDSLGIPLHRVILDLGFGAFNQNSEALLEILPTIVKNFPSEILIGISRKGFLARFYGAGENLSNDEKDKLTVRLTKEILNKIEKEDHFRLIFRVHNVPIHQTL
jgi:dihydropteroate synthase